MASRSRWHLGWDDVQPEAFRKFEDRDFERLCWELVLLEAKERHADGAVPEGPPQQYAPGKDFGLRVKRAPKTTSANFRQDWNVQPLTGDALGSTVFSCKTGTHWRKTVLDEARNSSPWALDALLGGGNLVLLVNVPVDRDAPSPPKQKDAAKKTVKTAKSARKTAAATKLGAATPRTTASLKDELARIYGERMRLKNPGGSDPIDRIRIIDANDLKEYVCCRKPNDLSVALRNKLGAEPIPGLLLLDQWRLDHDHDRGTPGFVMDPTRAAVQDQLRAVLTSDTDDIYGRTAWLVGAPGIGKTRLVIETLRTEDLLYKRAVVALSLEVAVSAVRNCGLYDRFPTAVLIVDDCPPDGLDDLLPYLPSTNHQAKGGLVVLTPMAPEWSRREKVRAGISRIELEPLDETALGQLITDELGRASDRTKVASIARLAEGFPWYAVLVAKEVGRGAPAPTTAAGAAKLALCSKQQIPRDTWESEVLVRAKALLVAMLTENIAWMSLGDEDRESLCKAVGVSQWSDVTTATQRCIDRGLLRVRLKGAYKYVTPAVLEREVARMLLNPPDGTEPRGPHLEKHVRRFLPRFYERLQQLGIDIDVLTQLAYPIVRALEDGPPGLAGLGRGGVSGASLRFGARYQPAAVARSLRRRIDEASLDELRARTDLRRDLVFALQALARRDASFDDAEPALFRLAMAENEAFANNATGEWTSLFLVEISATYRRFEQKLPLLRAHCLEGDSAARLLGLKGLSAAIATRSWNLAGEELDGPYPAVTRAEAHMARLCAWSLLAECARDPDTAVASRARELMINELDGAVRSGVVDIIAPMLASLIPCLDESEARKLRDAITWTGERHRQIIEQTGASEAWDALASAAEPRSFGERLRQRVGAGGRAAHRDAELRDTALAQEGLSRPDLPVLGELDWLSSTDAVRSTPFMIALGEADREASLLNPLLERARSGNPDLFTAYLRGFQKAGREGEVDALLRRLRSDDAFAETVALAVWRLGATDERLRFVVEDLRAGRLPERILSMFSLGSWEKDASDDSLAPLVDALLDRDSPQATAIALNLIVNRVKERRTSGARWKDSLARVVKRAAVGERAGMVSYDWELGAKELVAMGEVAMVSELAVKALSGEDDVFGADEVWSVLQECVKQDPQRVWTELAKHLEVDGRAAWMLAKGSSQHGISSALRASDVLPWVNHGEPRARLVAEMVDMHESPDLPEIARELIVRFGPQASCSRLLATQVESTPHVVSSLAEFVGEQLERARAWTTDTNHRVQAWAAALVADLERSHERHAADEEYERRRWGT